MLPCRLSFGVVLGGGYRGMDGKSRLRRVSGTKRRSLRCAFALRELRSG
jgi:hypothetical protein